MHAGDFQPAQTLMTLVMKNPPNAPEDEDDDDDHPRDPRLFCHLFVVMLDTLHKERERNAPLSEKDLHFVNTAKETLLFSLAHDPADDAMKAYQAVALARLLRWENPTLLPALVRLANDPSEDVRKSAAWSMGEMGLAAAPPEDDDINENGDQPENADENENDPVQHE